MRYGFVVPFADVRDFVDLAVLGEQSGWDAVFTWEALWGVDAWESMAAASVLTETIRMGTLLTPVPRVRPWDLATRVGTLDRLSGGRAILGAGLGAVHDGWLAFEPDEGRKVRAEKLDEALAIYAGLMGGQPFSYEGKHYSAKPTTFYPPDPPVQQPFPPVWVVGAHVLGRSRQRSLERASRWSGLLPQWLDPGNRVEESGIDGPERMATIVGEVRTLREAAGLPWDGYDVVLEADSYDPSEPTLNEPAAWAEAGVTWWVEGWWNLEPGPASLAELRRRVAAGPPAS